MGSVVAASIVSITLNPLLYRLAPGMEKVLARWRALRPKERAGIDTISDVPPAPDRSRHSAVVVGYGPVGRAVTSLLEHRGIEPTVIDLNIETIRQLRKSGKRAVHGDAAHPGILKEAGIANAIELIITPPSSPESAEIIRTARQMNPSIRVLARSAYLSECAGLLDAGANGVFSAEAEISMAMIQQILNELGTTPEQMDRERARVREELYKPSSSEGSNA